MINPRLSITKTLAQSYMRRLDLEVRAIMIFYLTPVRITGVRGEDAPAIADDKLVFRLCLSF
ncbi:hypothetical protein [Nostoc sp.]|uniref:hypothetical protein n=1 Tax=Nostoc sp. TaxID=1180 RepID=UPI002FFC33E2